MVHRKGAITIVGGCTRLAVDAVNAIANGQRFRIGAVIV